MPRDDEVTQTCGLADNLRSAICSAMEQHLHSSAISFGLQLTQLPNARMSDYVLFAKCFVLSGEHRRCLASLEHRGLLAANNILEVSRCLGTQNKAEYEDVDIYKMKCIVSAIQLAANCLLFLKEYKDCLTLLAPITSEVESIHKDESKMRMFYKRSEIFSSGSNTDINPIASLFCVVGRCLDLLENRPKAQLMLTVALRVDELCTEAVDYMVLNGLIGQRDKHLLVEEALASCARKKNDWLSMFYSDLLTRGDPVPLSLDKKGTLNAATLAQRADYMYSRCRPEEAYRLAREAYIIDPFDWNGGVLVYIVSMVELGLKTELFYLGHELAQSHPGQAVTWYCIGCYYWCCKKLAMAQAFMLKATKLDKRFARAWVALGHVLVAAEESEHAISAYRTACRLLPGDHRAPTFMAKELIRTNNVTLAVHILQGAHQLCPDDPITLNELGVASLSLDDIDEALHYFELAVRVVSQFKGNYKYIDSEEILCNYGTCLRRAKRLDEALQVYQRCLAMNPMSTENHANVGFTLHLLKRFSEAIEYYHTVLGFEPAHAFCAEMLNNAIEDSMSLAGLTDKGPVSLLFGNNDVEVADSFNNGMNDSSSGIMELSPLMNNSTSERMLGAPMTADENETGHTHSPGPRQLYFAGDSTEINSIRSDSHVRFDMSGIDGSAKLVQDRGSIIRGDFRHLNRTGDPETPFSTSGSVCPFPGFGLPSTGTTAKNRTDISAGSVEGLMASPRMDGQGIDRSEVVASVEYSPYSYINAVGGARRVSLNMNRNVSFPEHLEREARAANEDLSVSMSASSEPASRGVTNLSGIYSAASEESRTDFELCGNLEESFQTSSPSVMSFSRVTGNLSWSADGETPSRDSAR